MKNNDFEFMFQERSNKSTSKQVWSISKFLILCSWQSAKFLFKYTPKALGIAWQVKKEISNEIAKSVHNTRQEQKQLALEEKIKSIKHLKKD